MFNSSRKRSMILSAALVTAASVALGLVSIAPAQGTTPAQSEAVITMLQANRANDNLPSFSRNGFVDEYAQAFAAAIVSCGGCSNPITPQIGLQGSTDIESEFTEASGGTDAQKEARIANDFTQEDGALVFQPGSYVGIGWATSGSVTYAAMTVVKYSAAPNDRLVPGTVTLPSSAAVGTAVVPTIKGFGPGSPDYSYTWKSGAATVGTASSYTPVVGDIGNKISVAVQATEPGFTIPPVITTVMSKAVVAGTVHAPSSVTVSGSRNVGKDLSAGFGGWSPAGVVLHAQWYRNGVAIQGQIFSSYTQTASDLGKKIDVKVTGTLPGYTSATKGTSDKTLTAAELLTTTPVPTIDGTATVGQTLTLSSASWGPAPVALTFQWKANGAKISGATKGFLALSSSLAGKSITVTVTGKKSGWTSVSETSAPTADVARQNWSDIGTLSVTGIAEVGHTQTAVAGTWSPKPTSFTYQWIRGNSNISGATSKTYKTTSKDEGQTISVKITAHKAGYVAQAGTSIPRLISAP